ncbi:MAG: vWA domain-containing protein, partial [Saprospiraceae bacterium]
MKGVVKNNVNIFSKPSDTSYERSVAEKFTILFMFQIPGTETAEKNGFLYVGKTPKQAIGYVKASEVVKWNHRLCVNFTDMAGRQPALVYGDYNELKGEDWDKNKIPNSNAIAQEPTAKPSIKLDMMMPVLEQKSLCQKGSYQDCQQAYKIGFLAGRDIEKEVIKEEVGSTNLDMMFLIDATGSMGEEIDGAKQIVEEIAKGLSSDKTVRFGITLYKDKGDEYITKQVLSLTNSYRSVTSTLSKIEASGGDDLPEAMFPGVSSAIKNTNWRKADKDAVLRVVIIIGDASGHDYTDYNKDDLITEASDNKVRFIALKVNSENPGDNRTHEGQLKDLTQGLRDGDKGLYLRTEAYTGEL